MCTGTDYRRADCRCYRKGSTELAKYVRYYDYVVAQDGTGDFFTVQGSDKCSTRFSQECAYYILVRKGTYKEKIIIPNPK